MTEWIHCNTCFYRFKSFISTCPMCKTPVAKSVSDKTQMLKGYNFKVSNIKNKRKTLFLSISIIALLAIAAFAFHPSSNGNQISVESLKQYALKKINEDRAKYGLSPIMLDNNFAAQAHADELLKTETISHWTLDGMKPYMRYSIYGGNDSIAQNVAQEKYGMVSYNVWNIGNDNPSTDIEGQIQIDLCKMGIPSCPDTIDNPFKVIDNLEYKMINDDVKCCDNGHRLNILDGNHTYVSLGVAYNKFYFALVQNFENKDTLWNKPVTYNNVTGEVSLSGQIKEPNANFSGISISYDPLPSKQVYDDNHNRESYDSGKDIAFVVKKMPSFYNGSSQIKLDNYSSIELISADKWNVQNSHNVFDISFPLQNLIDKYGKGVYTINTFYEKNNDPLQATSKSIFIQ